MELDVGRCQSRKNPKKLITDNLSKIYPHDLQMYTIPPGHEITPSEFEELASERLQLLRILEQATQDGHKLHSPNWNNAVKSELRKQKLLKFLNLLDRPQDDGMANLQARRADHISHFILRLAYCRSEDLRRWFLTREQEWFKMRFCELTPDSLKEFLELNKLPYNEITADEKEDIRSQLYQSTSGVNEVALTNFYKVPVTQVCTVVKDKRVYIHGGFAYIPDSELIACILPIFRAQLSEALAYASRKVPLLDDDRLNSLFANLHTSHDNAMSECDGAIDIQYLDQYARKHFPLCMRHIHETFRANHHMKHGSCFQYGLFVKGIGVTFDDAMRFWRDEFTKLIDENTFDKKYMYLVKHHYGKVGSMINYSPYSCMKIISGGVGFGEHHGCPFRHFDAINLQQKIVEHGVDTKGIKGILDLVKNMHFEKACTKYFECMHGQPSKNVIKHPNQYFEESRAIYAEGGKGAMPSGSKSS